ncbi:MAG: ABC transporter ATP-binding protein, partial [Spirochaetales bacterium]|nr:ABC transporter ATP-binding protein [Candidatus Physcosoma equi]
MIKTLLSRVREYKGYTLVTPLLMILEVTMEVLIPAIMARIIDVGVENMDMKYILLMSCLLVLSALFSLAFGTLASLTGSKAAAGFATNLRHDLYEKVQDLSFADIDKFSPSSLVTRLTTDVQSVQMMFTMTIRMFVRSPIMLIMASIMAAQKGGRLALVFLFSIPFLVGGILFMVKCTHKYFQAAFKGYDRFNQVVGENLSGIRTVKAYVREEEEK